MNYFLRNNKDDFYRWYRHIVPYARAELLSFKAGKSVAIFRDDYQEALRVKRQECAIKRMLNDEQAHYLEEVLIKRKPYEDNSIYKPKTYEEIFQVWRTVCFPNGKPRIKTVDPVLLGGEMMALRTRRCIPAKHVAELVGIAEKTLYCYEEGIRMMRVDTFYKLCQIYKTGSNDIFDKASL